VRLAHPNHWNKVEDHRQKRCTRNQEIFSMTLVSAVLAPTLGFLGDLIQRAMPGAAGAENLTIGRQLRRVLLALLETNAIGLGGELMGFVLVVVILDIELIASAYRAGHNRSLP
jgi:hypothetical protein